MSSRTRGGTAVVKYEMTETGVAGMRSCEGGIARAWNYHELLLVGRGDSHGLGRGREISFTGIVSESYLVVGRASWLGDRMGCLLLPLPALAKIYMHAHRHTAGGR